MLALTASTTSARVSGLLLEIARWTSAITTMRATPTRKLPGMGKKNVKTAALRMVTLLYLRDSPGKQIVRQRRGPVHAVFLRLFDLAAQKDICHGYQLALRTPGIRPALARSRKQMRQMPNLRYTARARPHSLQRRFIRIRSRGATLILSGVRLLASSFSICLRNLTFCASVVMASPAGAWFGCTRTGRALTGASGSCCRIPHRQLAGTVLCRRKQKKPTWWNTRRYSTTSAYSSTSPPARPGCPLASHPTTSN
jgi:hypothetical protein